MTPPRYSVIVPTFHRHNLLVACLQRLAPGVQTLDAAAYEVIVGDDGHTAAAALRSAFPWVEWLAGPGRGPAANRNAAAVLARGAWLAFTDDDCLPEPGWLQAYHEALPRGGSIFEGVTTCQAGVHTPMEHAPINLTGGWLWSCNLLVQREFFLSVGGFDEGFPHPHFEDVEFRERTRKLTVPVFVPQAVVDHPPRRVATGVRMAVTHESRFYFDALNGRRTGLLAFPMELLRGRLQAIRRRRLGWDTWLAVLSLFEEMFALARLAPAWRKKYEPLRRSRS